MRQTGCRNTRHTCGSYQTWRQQPARFCRHFGAARRFPAALLGIRARLRAVPEVRRADQAEQAGAEIQLLLPALPEITGYASETKMITNFELDPPSNRGGDVGEKPP